MNSINKAPALEKILAAGPELIFISYMEKHKADALQKKLNIPVVVLSYGPFGSFDETVYTSLRIAGKVLGKDQRAEAVITFILDIQKDLHTRTQTVPVSQRARAYVGGIGRKGTQGIESTDASYMPFDWVGVHNVAAEQGHKAHLFIDKERLLALDPDIIFLDAGGSPRIMMELNAKRPYYMGLRAFQQKRVFSLHAFNWYVTNIGTVCTDAYTVGKQIYPKAFSDIDLGVKADEIYGFLLGKPVYQTMKETQGVLGQCVLP